MSRYLVSLVSLVWGMEREQAISQERAEKIVRAIAKGELCNN
ncbi:hypothetical protein COO91_09649 (plasmid) [Nostoc flagelliforme CCNUN1]|uniref:Uncharacterized protein n=1 Tax=Nostoc flagelliforme CCNUN1 TaxID=2038116 RepID=A0A2K8T6Y7_9NOSO|nr:hypothetical protein COO91_09649 [Nostoc flagelliforme CCNUN1]